MRHIEKGGWGGMSPGRVFRVLVDYEDEQQGIFPMRLELQCHAKDERDAIEQFRQQTNYRPEFRNGPWWAHGCIAIKVEEILS